MARDTLGETRAFVEKWRKDNGLEGTKTLPNTNEVPYKWMVPLLKKVQSNTNQLKIRG
tara:strand:+ start:526 stop:699 length:174 start_codon:yes stop_codon:yes gene_type:complete